MAHNLANKALRVSSSAISRPSRRLPCSTRLLSSPSSPSSPSVVTATSPPSIAIVGGGPAGLTLAALLHRRRVPFTVFELRPRPTAAAWARPSGMLDLHEPDGLRAIRACGLYDQFLPLTGECSEEFVLADKSGARVPIKSADGSTTATTEDERLKEAKVPATAARPEISRNNLAQLLLTRIPPESVRWGHKLRAATYSNAGGVTTLDFGDAGGVTTLDFGDAGGTHEFDLVVGADGAWSRVRTLVTPARPRYGNAQVVTATIRHLSTRYPHLAALVGTGSFSALGDRHAVVSQRGPHDSARVYVWLTTTDEKLGATAGLAARPPTAARELLLDSARFLGAFGPRVKDLVATALAEQQRDDELEQEEKEEGSGDGTTKGLDIRPLYALPYGTSWAHKKGVALIGDAAHVMLPNGEGVNQAMLDATLLADAIVGAYDESVAGAGASGAGDGRARFGDVLAPRVEAFEREMTQRAVRVGEETEQLLGMMLGPDAAETMAKFFLEHQGQQ
ncbi:hypothetical protein V2A60_007156 [Cordyceps javanica]|uniref:Salicylate hydroxylase n=1 Tax=Cordyceps javanica TaxID=43265 RepID=A0A545VRK2_9HYPO|nr:salicylate hydroxylase [Cordyceps javanica]TQW04294.1 salicylate hydroxylase [Cordyceps javanica]